MKVIDKDALDQALELRVAASAREQFFEMVDAFKLEEAKVTSLGYDNIMDKFLCGGPSVRCAADKAFLGMLENIEKKLISQDVYKEKKLAKQEKTRMEANARPLDKQLEAFVVDVIDKHAGGNSMEDADPLPPPSAKDVVDAFSKRRDDVPKNGQSPQAAGGHNHTSEQSKEKRNGKGVKNESNAQPSGPKGAMKGAKNQSKEKTPKGKSKGIPKGGLPNGKGGTYGGKSKGKGKGKKHQKQQ